MRFWVSWWSSTSEDQGCIGPPIQYWISGYRASRNRHVGEDDEDFDDCSVIAVIDAEDEDAVWEGVAKYWPDYDERFCEPKADDFSPGDRFPGFENKTRLV